jgi:hypothetical protein
MASKYSLYQTQLTPAEISNYAEKIEKNTFHDGKCKLFSLDSITDDGYGFFMISFRGRPRKKIRVHRLAYIAHLTEALTPDQHVSHLCHNKLCTNLEHLLLESQKQKINNRRNYCKNRDKCNRRHYPYCIF